MVTAAACCAALVFAPAAAAATKGTSTGAVLTTAPATPASSPGVAVVAVPSRPVVGASVRLTVTSPPPGATGFSWDLSGHGIYGSHTGRNAHIEAHFASPGMHSVAVRFTAAGQTRLAVLTVNVTAAPSATPRAAHRTHAPAPLPADRAHAHLTRPRHSNASGLSGRVTAHAAGDPGVTVADFHFAPASTTIHVGDTITWTNDGPSSHTATAHGGAFDTGVLKKGQSASHTFTQPGTFTYFCQIHPFMHGTIVVLAAATTTTHATTSTTPATATTAVATTPTATTPAAPAGPTLPNTGFDVAASLFAGLGLLGVGLALRRTRAR